MHTITQMNRKSKGCMKKKTDTKEYILYIILLNSRNGNEPLVTESRSEVAWFQGQGESATKCFEGSFWNHENIQIFIYWAGNDTEVYICQISSNCTLIMYS